MFESLSDKLQTVFKKLSGKGRVSESDVNEAMREVRMALLEADVNFRVVKDFVARVKEKAVGVDVLESLSPAQQVVKIVNDELIALLGGEADATRVRADAAHRHYAVRPAGRRQDDALRKLAQWFKKQGRNPLMVACDIYRPAAIRQLQVLGEQVNASRSSRCQPIKERARPALRAQAIQQATQNGNDIVLLDTAGRLAIDDELMDELGQMKAWVKPHEILLVVDAMVGQDAVNFAQQFNEKLALTGFVMTKMDGDTRGGAALSIREITGVPIKFLGTGEKLDALESFLSGSARLAHPGHGRHPQPHREGAGSGRREDGRRDSRGVSRENKFDLNDFLEQMQMMKKMGPLENIIKMLPGISAALPEEVKIDPKVMARKEAIVQSMTPKERTNPQIITGSRRRRIAPAAVRRVQEINQFLTEFEQMRKMMRMAMAQKPGGKGPAIRPPGSPGPPRPAGSLRKMPKGGRRFGFPFRG